MFCVCIYVVSGSPANAIENDNQDDYGISVPATAGITFVVTLVVSVFITLVIVYVVYKMKKKPVTDNAKVALSNTLTTDGDSIIKEPKSTCDDENYEFPDNLPATSANRYQSNPMNTSMQANPAYGMPQSSDEIYENIN